MICIANKSAYLSELAINSTEIKKIDVANILKPFLGDRTYRSRIWKSMPELIKLDLFCDFLKKLKINNKVDGHNHNGRMYVFTDFLINFYKLELDDNGFPLFNEKLRYEDLSEEAWFTWRWIHLYVGIYSRYELKHGEFEIQRQIEINKDARFNYKLDLYLSDLKIGCEINESHHECTKGKENDKAKADLMKSCGDYSHNFYTSEIGLKKHMRLDKKHETLKNNKAIKRNLDMLKELIEIRAIFLDETFRFRYTTNMIIQKIKENRDITLENYNELVKKGKKKIENPDYKDAKELYQIIEVIKIFKEKLKNYKLLFLSTEKSKPIIEELYGFRNRAFSGSINDKIISFNELLSLLKVNEDSYIQELKLYITVLVKSEIKNEDKPVVNWVQLIDIIRSNKAVDSVLKFYLEEYAQCIEGIFIQFMDDIKRVTIDNSANYNSLMNCFKVYTGNFTKSLEKNAKKKKDLLLKENNDLKSTIKQLEDTIKKLDNVLVMKMDELSKWKDYYSKPQAVINEIDDYDIEYNELMEFMDNMKLDDSLSDCSAYEESDQEDD